MTTIELRKRLIKKIRETKDNSLLEEAWRLFELDTEDIEIYKLSDAQIQAVSEAREQIKEGKYVTGDEADKEIDEWLGK